jgi:hypothetical protein
MNYDTNGDINYKKTVRNEILSIFFTLFLLLGKMVVAGQIYTELTTLLLLGIEKNGN